MKLQFMFLTVLIPGPSNPKDKLDVFLQPLIKELNDLWSVGANTYDCSLKNNFQLRAALMWTISDFPAYSMLSGWSTSGRKTCPYCMERSDALTLGLSKKQSWFDNHRKFLYCDHKFHRNRHKFTKGRVIKTPKLTVRSGTEILADIEKLNLRKVTEEDAMSINAQISKTTGWRKKSIFWDLPYWSTNMIRHNLDVMHIEKNVFDNIFNTVMNVKGKTKDTFKSRMELNDYCNKPEYAPDEGGKMPSVPYALAKEAKKALCEWVKTLRFPDGYASNLGRCVDMTNLRLIKMKSHDCHVFMQRLIPIAFRELLPPQVWKALNELSLFFKDITSTSIRREDMERLKSDIPLILCQLEMIFPPSLFNFMEHLPVHLPYEARIASPVQYRWMYPFESYMGELKVNVTNKARVEGSIANACVVEEAANFCSYYFDDDVTTNRTALRRNESPDRVNELNDEGIPEVFIKSGQTFGTKGKRVLEEREIFEDQMKCLLPNITDDDLSKKVESKFPDWFKNYARDSSNNVNVHIRTLAEGPARWVKTYTGCKINGYRFHTLEEGTTKSTSNSGVCIKASNYGPNEIDYYGRLVEILELDFSWRESKKVLMFKCEWFDTTQLGTKIHPQYKLVDINHKRRYKKYEPFVIAEQATQLSRVYWDVRMLRLRSDRARKGAEDRNSDVSSMAHRWLAIDRDPTRNSGIASMVHRWLAIDEPSMVWR
ncbi:hypothetical protein CASFOL_014534 [Castilleja foliolosa]|uniref:Transposase n=1 Tax=Castilleja foliolosa TaxID=1961234 RepID=A0ABD3DS64_9LAMI